MPQLTQTFTTKSLADTKALGQRIGARLKGNEVLAMQAELGGGKTSFVQGLAQGLGIVDRVISPTFVLERIYKKPSSDRPVLYHYDLYRLTASATMELGLEELWGKAPVVIEWAEKIKDQLPPDTIWIKIMSPNPTVRKFNFYFHDHQKYLFE